MATKPLVFLADPSLEEKNSRERNLLRSVAASHVAKRRHSRSVLLTPTSKLKRALRPRKLSQHETGEASRRSDQYSTSGLNDAVTRTLHEWEVAHSPYLKQPALSTYLQETYRYDDRHRVTMLCDFYHSFVGPVCVWRPFSRLGETQNRRRYMLGGFFEAPALTEVMLAWLQHLNDERTGQRSGKSVSTDVLNHQQRALGLLRRWLNVASAANSILTIWIVITHLSLNNLMGDRASFETNMNGLRRLVALRGGLDKLEQQDPRACHAVQQVETMAFDRQKSSAEFATLALPLLEKADQTDKIETAGSHPESPTVLLPEGFSLLAESGHLGRRTISLLRSSVEYLQLVRSDDSAVHQGRALRQDFLKLFTTSRLTKAELFLCTSAAVLCHTEQRQLNSGSRWDADSNWLGRGGGELINRLLQVRQSDAALNRRSGSEDWVEPYEIWTAFIIGSIPTLTSQTWSNRRCILLHNCITKRNKANYTWHNVSVLLEDFYMNDTLRTTSKILWRKAIAEANSDMS